MTKEKKCKKDEILNPKTNRCVKKNGLIGKSIVKETIEKTKPTLEEKFQKAKVIKKQESKACKKNQIINPKTNRCIKRDGTIGKKLSEQFKKSNTQEITEISWYNELNAFEPYFKDTPFNMYKPYKIKLESKKIKTFSSNSVDVKWINSQVSYWKQLSYLDKLYLYSYTYKGDKILNIYLKNGVKDLDISLLKKTCSNQLIHHLLPVFLEYVEQCPYPFDAKETKLFLNKKLTFKEITLNFKKFLKIIDKDTLQKNLPFLMEKYVEKINRIIENSPKLKRNLIVVRGTSQKMLSYKPEWTKRFISTSVSMNIGIEFYDNEGSLDVYILDKNVPCVPIIWSRYPNENEILLSSDCCRFTQINEKMDQKLQNAIHKQLKLKQQEVKKFTQNIIRVYKVSQKSNQK